MKFFYLSLLIVLFSCGDQTDYHFEVDIVDFESEFVLPKVTIKNKSNESVYYALDRERSIVSVIFEEKIDGKWVKSSDLRPATRYHYFDGVFEFKRNNMNEEYVSPKVQGRLYRVTYNLYRDAKLRDQIPHSETRSRPFSVDENNIIILY